MIRPARTDGWLRLAVHRPGGEGRARRGTGGHRAPVHLGRLLYPDATAPDMAYAYVAMLGGGLIAGDRLAIEVEAASGSRLHVTTTGATRLYGGDRSETDGAGDDVRQRIDLRAGPGSTIEWWPDATIPYRGAAFRSDLTVTVAEDATVLVADTVLPGRVARGEWHDAAAYATRTIARRPDGRLLVVDAQVLAPAPAGARHFRDTLPSGRGTIVTVLAFVPGGVRDAAVDNLRDCLARGPSDLARAAGVSLLPNDAGVALRALAADGQEARTLLDGAWKALRRASGMPEPETPRKT